MVFMPIVYMHKVMEVGAMARIYIFLGTDEVNYEVIISIMAVE
jgi:hypothetical protein